MEVVRRKFKLTARNRRRGRANFMRYAVLDPRRATARNRATYSRRKGMECDFQLLLSIPCPETCFYLGTPISFERGKGHRPPENTASFDRIDPARGYVAGNVRIISKKANTMKSNSTPDERFRMTQVEMQEQADRFAPV